MAKQKPTEIRKVIPRAIAGHVNSGPGCEQEKREYWRWKFAGMFMVNLVLDSDGFDYDAKHAIDAADCLIKELEGDNV